MAGAVDILVEALSEDVHLRSMTYQEVLRRSKITSQVKDESLDENKSFRFITIFQKQLLTCKVTVRLPLIVVRS